MAIFRLLPSPRGILIVQVPALCLGPWAQKICRLHLRSHSFTVQNAQKEQKVSQKSSEETLMPLRNHQKRLWLSASTVPAAPVQCCAALDIAISVAGRRKKTHWETWSEGFQHKRIRKTFIRSQSNLFLPSATSFRTLMYCDLFNAVSCTKISRQ